MQAVLDHLDKKSREEPRKNKSLIANLVSMQESKYGTTLLHIASRKWGNEVVKRLLNLGASINLIDINGKSAVTTINPDVLEKFLDSKWSLQEEKDPFYYNDHDQEMEISKSPEHEDLLTHPVISTYLAREWGKISVLYDLNIFFTMIFTAMLNVF